MSREVLVVDDDPFVRHMLGLALPEFGFGVRLTASGSEAVELYRQHHRALDGVLLDVRMDGLNGPQTLAALQQINPAVRCCFMSGYSPDHSGEELRRLGAVAFLEKPFVLDDLVQALVQLTEQAATADPPPGPERADDRPSGEAEHQALASNSKPGDLPCTAGPPAAG